MTWTGASEDYDYSFNPQTVDVTVQGLQDDLDAMSEEDLGAVLDLSGMTAGTRAGTLTFDVADGLEVLNSSPFEITVTDRRQGAAADDGATEEEDAEEAAAESAAAENASESTDHE